MYSSYYKWKLAIECNLPMTLCATFVPCLNIRLRFPHVNKWVGLTWVLIGNFSNVKFWSIVNSFFLILARSFLGIVSIAFRAKKGCSIESNQVSLGGGGGCIIRGDADGLY